MPIYAFQCTRCGHEFDRLQKMSDPDPDACPACRAATVRRKVTAAQFRLAGSGWYETDFKGSNEKKNNLAGSHEPPAAGAGEKGGSAASAATGTGKTDAGA